MAEFKVGDMVRTKPMKVVNIEGLFAWVSSVEGEAWRLLLNDLEPLTVSKPDQMMLEALKGLVDDVQAWCDAIENKGTGWDDWDEHYKGFAYRGGLEPARAAIAAAEQSTPDKGEK